MSEFEILLEMLANTPNRNKNGDELWSVRCYNKVNVISVSDSADCEHFASFCFDKEGCFLGLEWSAEDVVA